MSHTQIELIQRALSGEASAVKYLSSAQSQLSNIEDVLVVEPKAVIRVLRDLQSGVISETTAQRWAFWVRQGFLPNSGTPVCELPIEWPQDEFDEAMANATTRLEELGDVVDGEFRPGEIDELVRALGKTDP